MKKGLFSKVLPHLIAVVIFVVVAAFYCSPVLEGKVVNQHDILGWKGMAQQSFEYKEQHGHFPLWTNSLFSGMPAYTVAMDATKPILTGYLHGLMTLWLPKPINFFFLASICFYFLCCVLRIRPWIGIMAALSYAYATYDPVIIAVGHDTKMQAIGLAPAVIGSLLLILRREYLWGAALFIIVFSYQVGTQHLQIIYYTGFMCLFVIVAALIAAWRSGELKQKLISLPIALGAAIIGFLTFAVSMLPLREYAQLTMRGGHSALTQTENKKNKTEGGLDKDYAFSWSYGISETLTLVVPGIYGGSNGGQEHSGTTAFTEKMTEVGFPEDQALQMTNSYSYWGPQTLGTSGTVYLGAVICFLFILAMVYLDTWHKWWIIAVTLFGILLAWGKHFSAFNYFLFDYLPLYNKFRAPTMSLVMPQLTFPLAGAMVVNQLLNDDQLKANVWKKFRLSVYVAAGLAAILIICYLTFNYTGSNDTQIRENFTNAMLSQASQGGQPSPQMQQQAQSFGQEIVTSIKEDRKSLFGRDLLRSLFFMAAAVVLLGAYIKGKLKPMPLMIILLVLSTIDLLPIGRRYLNNESFVEPSEFESFFTPTAADQQIKNDPNKPFRVFDQTDPQGPFQSSRASYFHNSVGGYHPAKLSIYQDLIEKQLSNGNMAVFNMLNTKYFITPDQSGRNAVAQLNPDAFGPVWLVKSVRFVNSPDEEMAALDKTSLRDTAIVQQSFKTAVTKQPVFDSSATMKVVEYNNDEITYSFAGKSDQFAVFSEIYYPLGWKAFIDGKETPYAKTNYVLRGMTIPAGNHKVQFKFEPQSYIIGNNISFISSLIAILVLAAAIFWEFRRRNTGAATTV